MSVHYKFKSALDFDTITFDGLHISVSDLKKAIVHQKRLGKTQDFDLQITNAQTKEEFKEDSCLIPKNTSLIIARVPLAAQPKKPWDPQAEKSQHNRSQQHDPDRPQLDLSQMNGSEEDKIQEMMKQSTLDYEPHKYQRVRGQGQTGDVPTNYRCFKCHKPGHWIKNCPLNLSHERHEMKRNTGIPRSFIADREAEEANPKPAEPAPVEQKQEIPEDLICAICKDLFTDAVMIPCCGSSFCDECVRTALLESEDNECPDCKEKGSSPGSLIPNRFLRNSVNAFKNETGYNKPRQRIEPSTKEKEVSAPIVTETTEKNEPAEEADIHETDKTAEAELLIPEIETEKGEESTPSNERNEATVGDHKADATTHSSSHDEQESDYEDNITVKVPAAQPQSQRVGYRDRHYNGGRHSRHIRPPGIESSPLTSASPAYGEDLASSNADDKDGYTLHHRDHPHGQGIQTHHHHHASQQHHPVEQMGPGPQMHQMRSAPSDVYSQSGMPSGQNYLPMPPHSQMMAPGRPFEPNRYPMPAHPQGYVVPYMMGDRMRAPFPPRPGYPPMQHQMRPRQMVPNALASVYHGVAAKVGTGIIDDPLEAFNRIMREKEKRKEERRRSPIETRRRSRSIELNANRGRHSPPHHRPQRMRSPEERRMHSPPVRNRRARSRDRRSVDKDRRRIRSKSFSDRSSRSRSYSPLRKRSRSPPVRRRSRSRSPSFSISRSRSRSFSHGRFRGPPQHGRYNRSSPTRQMSPRFRQKENRRPERRDDFRNRSPEFPPRRARSRDRMPSPQFYRQERPPINHGPPEGYFNPMQPVGHYHGDAPPPQYVQNNRFPSREHQHLAPPHLNDRNMHEDPLHMHGEHFTREHEYKIDRYEDAAPPGTGAEPPPPGFEPNLERERRESWDHNHFDVRPYREEHTPTPKKVDTVHRREFPDRSGTPELNDRQLVEREERRRHETREREGRSWSRSSRHSPPLTHLRNRSRSKTPVRMERNQEHFPGREFQAFKEIGHGANKERHTGHGDKDRLNHDRRKDRDERDRKNVEKDKKEPEKKDTKHGTSRDIGGKEKNKDKEKRKDSTDDERKDKKGKEKVKKKKEKDPEKKKKKKEKKEKEKKEKEELKKRLKEEKAKEKAEKLKLQAIGQAEAEIHSNVEAPDSENLSQMEDVINRENLRIEPSIKADEFLQHELKNEWETDDENDGKLERTETLRNVTKQEKHQEEMTPPKDISVKDDQKTSPFKLEISVHRHVESGKDSKITDFDENKIGSKNQDDDATREDGEILDDEDGKPEKTHSVKQTAPVELDLYGDICQQEEIRFDYNEKPLEINRSDSILEIHANLDFETDLYDIESGERKKDNGVFVPIPEPSRWERDEDNQIAKEEKISTLGDEASGIEDKSGKVTTEVIKRAEHAIFAKAINAIRPIEIKKISMDRQKLYSTSDSAKEICIPSSVVKPGSPMGMDVPVAFQITVPAKGHSHERSVEVKNDRIKKTTPVRSVKDRLGSKVQDSAAHRHLSRSATPPRKVVEHVRQEKVSRTGRSRSRDQALRRNIDVRAGRRAAVDKRATEPVNRSRDHQRDVRGGGGDYPRGERSREKPSNSRNRDIERKRGPVSSDRQRENVREQDKVREHKDDRRISADHGRDRVQNLNRSRENFLRNRENRDVKEHQSRAREQKTSKELDKSKQRDRQGERSVSKLTENERTTNRPEFSEAKQSKSPKRKRPNDDNKSPQAEKKSKVERARDEAKDSDRQTPIPQVENTRNEEKSKFSKSQREKIISLADPNLKRSHSQSESSSSSSGSGESDSDSESGDAKKKKKRKHKRKKTRRSSSADTAASTTKHKKNKKKKSKKKKKNKK